MQARLNIQEVAPDIIRHAVALQTAIEATGLSRTILELVKIRASQLNGCAFCLHIHTTDARKNGESDVRMLLLSGWRESTLFSASERAVLAYVDAMTGVDSHPSVEPLYEELARHFAAKELAGIVNGVAMINFWNRVAIGLGYVHPAESAS